MKTRSLILAVACVSAALGSSTFAQSAPSVQQKLSPALRNKFRTLSTSSSLVQVVVRFKSPQVVKGKGQLKNLRNSVEANIGSSIGQVRGNGNLKKLFSTQSLNAAANKLAGGEKLWLDNSVVLTVTLEQAELLANLPNVEYVFDNFRIPAPKVQAQSATTAPAGTPWHLQKVGAPQLWAAGFKGQGVRIGTLDTGIDPSHPELAGKLQAFAEFDGEGKRVAGAAPHDTGNHGTHTAGLLVGNTVGVAPSAKLLSALVLPPEGGTFAQVIAGMQWVIDPDNNAATDDGADVVSLSIGLPGLYNEFVQPTRNLINAGITPVYAAGNFGPGAGTVGSPGAIPEAISVGATTQEGAVAPYSSRGPVLWKDPYNNSFNKPDLVAPGDTVTSSVPGGGYAALSGTSQATPIVAGSIAVLLSAKPNLTIDQIKSALFSSAGKLGGGVNTVSGNGLLSLPAAAQALGIALSAPAPTPAPTPTPTPTPQPPSGQVRKLKTLLVMDDCTLDSKGTDALINFYRDPVKANASGAFLWVPGEQGAVPLSEMKKYQLLIWATGECYSGTVSAQDQSNLAQYLEGGGYLLVSGQDIGYEIGSSAFYQNYLKSKFVGDSSGNPRVDGGGVLQGATFILNGQGGAKNQYYPDVIAPLGGAALAGTWGTEGTKAGSLTPQSVQGGAPAPTNKLLIGAQSVNEPAGAIVLNDAGKYRTANVSFGIESLSAPERTNLLSKLMAWFGR